MSIVSRHLLSPEPHKLVIWGYRNDFPFGLPFELSPYMSARFSNNNANVPFAQYQFDTN
jgi:hypothetical protein